MQNTIVGFFDERIQAEDARAELIQAGFGEANIHLTSGSMDSTSAQNSSMSATGSQTSDLDQDGHVSFMERIRSFFGDLGEDWKDSEYAHHYAEGIRRGGTALTVQAEEHQLDEVSEILNRAGAVDIDRRAQFYKESGYRNFDLNAAPYSRDEALTYRQQFQDWDRERGADFDKETEQVIPVVEEKVNIGKRAIEKGRVRVFTRVIETPVTEEVRLRDEHIHVERRPVDRPVSAADMTAFKEGEIELRETSEEAVVNKEARVVEEVRVGKEVEERTETIRETARRTDVEVDRNDMKRDRIDLDENKRLSEDRTF